MRKLVSLMLSIVMAICVIFITSFSAKADTTAKQYDFSKMIFNYERGTEYSVSNGKLNATFEGNKYQEIQYKLPEAIDMSKCKNVTFNASSLNGKISFKLYNTSGDEVFAHYEFMGNGDCTFSPDISAKVDCIGILSMEDYKYSATINSVTFNMGALIEKDPIDKDRNLLTTYGKAFDIVGGAISASKLANKTVLDYVKEEHNSLSPGNEMKPDAILGYSDANLISVNEAKTLGYNIPDGYKESTIPKLDFTTVDKMLKTCYDNGLKMRGHTLVWHQQTPDWYFREGYTSNGAYVSKEVMDARMEFYIKTVMEHMYSSKYGDVLYAWDVVNEYLHGDKEANSGWQQIYGKYLGPKAGFVKKAFEYAYETLEKLGLDNKVKLFYNDYNTYEEVNDIIELVKNVNSNKKICAGVGMQSHLDITYPSADMYKNALQSFLNEGFEVQITELDVTCDSLDTQAKYYYDLMRVIMEAKKNGGNITALIFWGISDEDSWRGTQRPLLYSDYSTQKPAYESVLKAFEDSGYKVPVVTCPGDVNDDGECNVVDFIMLKKYISGSNVNINKRNADINSDGDINVLDLVALKKLIQ